MSDQLQAEVEKVFEVPPQPATYWPRISLVTAVYNGADYLEATIDSILSQGYPNLEYVVVDDGSTDETPDIIKRYQSYLTYTTRHPNRGLYGSLNVGFSHTSGEIMGWLNASDILHINSLFVVGSVFSQLSNIRWISGRPSVLSPSGMPIAVAERMPRWSRYPFLFAADRSIHGLSPANVCIQQESTFWRRSLWNDAGGAMAITWRAEGDFELWVRFFRHADLYSVDALIGAYRRHENSLSSSDMGNYHRTCGAIADRELASLRGGAWLRRFDSITRAIAGVPAVRSLWNRLAVRGLYGLLCRSNPPVITFRDERWMITG